MSFIKEIEKITGEKLKEIEKISWGKGIVKEGSKIVELSLKKMNIKELPSSISSLKDLRVLDLSFNELMELPDEICELKSLWELNLEGNKLIKLPRRIGDLPKLRKLNLLDNPKLDNLPASIRKFADIYSDFIELKIKYIGWNPYSRESITLLKKNHRIKVVEK